MTIKKSNGGLKKCRVFMVALWLMCLWIMVKDSRVMMDSTEVSSSSRTDVWAGSRFGWLFEAKRRPLVLGAGHGTTATHAMYMAVCELGVPSLHFMSVCAEGKRYRNPSKDDPLYSARVKHYIVLKRFMSAIARKERIGETHVRHAGHTEMFWKKNQTWLNEMFALIDELIADPSVDGLFDTPYPYFASYITKAAKRIRGVPPVVLLSERNATQWVDRRKNFAKGRVPLCYIPDGNSSTRVFFDIPTCFQESKMLQEVNPYPVASGATLPKISRIDVMLAQANAAGNHDKMAESIAQGFEQFQVSMRSQATFSVNLFEYQPRITEIELKKELVASLPQFDKYWAPTETSVEEGIEESA